MSTTSLRDQAAQKEREWRQLEQLQYDNILFIHLFLLSVYFKMI